MESYNMESISMYSCFASFITANIVNEIHVLDTAWLSFYKRMIHEFQLFKVMFETDGEERNDRIEKNVSGKIMIPKY